ncbi:hypothetical protein [Endozoicomonas atrinae]|uniref:hypothetical protein n=1 Tax=Endozoicomonas atrinae TaxID=1333660 RepID=UPI001112F1A5|nr:hypothetical protein [Endozoicomonas atrinae]
MNQNAQQQNSASSNGYAVKAMNGMKSAFSDLASAIPSPSSFSFTEKVEIVATGTIFLSQTAFAMANATDAPNGTTVTQGEPRLPDERGSLESGWPGWKTGLTVFGVAAGVIGIPLTAYCAWQKREKLCPSEHQPIPNDPNNAEPKELQDMSSKDAERAGTTSPTDPLGDVKEPTPSDQLLPEKAPEDENPELAIVKVIPGDDKRTDELSDIPLSP